MVMACNRFTECPQADIVDGHLFILWDIRAIHVHEDITNHDHGHLVLLPLLTDLAQKLLVWARSHRLGD
jgi:hypothetical protein